jgi:carbamate kinase
MLPKIEAAVDFVRNGGPQAIITDPPNLARALRGETGTRIIPGARLMTHIQRLRSACSRSH